MAPLQVARDAPWVSALDDAEFVAEWVGQDGRLVAAVVVVFRDRSSPEVDEALNFADEVVDEEVEVGAILDGLGFVDVLEGDVVKAAARRDECVKLCAVGERGRFVIAESLLPEGCGDCDVDAVDRDANCSIHRVPLQRAVI
jgi:hypothetical protein